MVTVPQSFEIIDGVRRAKAFELSGAPTIRAVVQNPDGTLGPEFDVSVAELSSPHKSEIDMSTASQANRFWRIWQAVQAGTGRQLPPIVVAPGSRGTPLKDVGWTY
jgi:hypothetical protein